MCKEYFETSGKNWYYFERINNARSMGEVDVGSMGNMKCLCAKSILGLQGKIDIILKELIMLELFGNKQYYLA